MKSLFLLFLGLMVIILNSCTWQNKKDQEFSYSFNNDDEGFVAIFADYHDDGNNLESYDMSFGYTDIPVKEATKGLFIFAQNRSDDLFMGFYKAINLNEANTTYEFTLTFDIATKYQSGSIGIGGSPADSVFVKGGVVNIKPATIYDENLNLMVLNLNKGNQSTSGETVKTLGTLAKPDGYHEQEYVFKSFTTTVQLETNDNGLVYIIIGTDSGFEGLTIYYLDNVKIKAIKK